MNSIGDDDNVGCVNYLNCLVNTASDSEQFHFSRSDVDSMMNSFGWNIVIKAYM